MMPVFLLKLICVCVVFLHCGRSSAKDYILPAEIPKDCVKAKHLPCSISTGDRPRIFEWNEDLWELDRNLVMQSDYENHWMIYQGMLVVSSKKPIKLQTPFAEIYLGRSKIMIHVMREKVRILSLEGEGIRVIQKGSRDEQYLLPGFQNWYGGIDEGESGSGVVSVINLDEFSQERAKFFLNHELGFPRELEQVASRIKWAADIAAQYHRELIERKMASLEESHQNKVLKKTRKIQFDKFLRRLFLKKIQYDY